MKKKGQTNPEKTLKGGHKKKWNGKSHVFGKKCFNI